MLLAIDTSGGMGSLALAEVASRELTGAEPVLRATAELAPRSFSTALLPELRTMLQTAGLRLRDLTGLVVVSGPGSFTGIRIGLSTAKALAEALALPLAAVSRLWLLAENGGLPRAALDAGRGELYVGDFTGKNSTGAELLAETLAEEGSGFAICEPGLAEAFPRAIETAAPTAADAIRSGWRRLRSGQTEDVALLDANYLRRSDAELFARVPPSPKSTLRQH